MNYTLSVPHKERIATKMPKPRSVWGDRGQSLGRLYKDQASARESENRGRSKHSDCMHSREGEYKSYKIFFQTNFFMAFIRENYVTFFWKT
jgi:Zn-finger nucleic acid-binding protein